MKKSLISLDKEVKGGAACIRGTRITAAWIYGCYKAGDTVEQLQRCYPQCTTEQIEAAIAYCKSKQHGGKVAAKKNFAKHTTPRS